MTEPTAAESFQALRDDTAPEAVITHNLIDALDDLARGRTEFGVLETVAQIVGGIAAIEIRLLDLEKHVHGGGE